MTHLVLVALGGAIGASLRHLAGLAALRLFGPAFPLGTLFVNVAGSFAMGILVAWLAMRAEGSSQNLRLFLATGVLGASRPSRPFRSTPCSCGSGGEGAAALLYVALSVALSIAALAPGLWISRSLA